MNYFFSFSLIQFYVAINTIITYYEISMLNINNTHIVLSILQYSICIIEGILIFCQWKQKKIKILFIFFWICTFTFQLIILTFNQDLILSLLIVTQFLSTFLLITLLTCDKKYAKIFFLGLIFIIGIFLNFIPLTLMVKGMFSFDRLIAILGLSTLCAILYILIFISFNKLSIYKELHIICSCYWFLELLICCMLIAETTKFNDQKAQYQILVIFTLLKFSNFILDVLIYPFAKLEIISMNIPQTMTQNTIQKYLSYPSNICMETECSSALKIIPEEKLQNRPKTQIILIKQLLELY